MRVNVHRPIQGRGVPARRGVSKTTRRAFIGALAGGLAAPLAAGAQQPAKVARIGFLGTGSPAVTAIQLEAFRQGLRDLGYAEGRNIVIEYRWAEGRVERFPDLAAELVGLKVDVIVATGTPVAHAAKNATRTIPIVFATAADPVGSELVAGIARPGGNVTGLSLLAPEIVARQLQLLKEAVPKASRVAVLSNPANSYTALLVKETEAAARSLGVRVQLLGVRAADAFDSAFSAITKERPGALFVLFDPLFFAHQTRIAEFANKNRLPAMYPHREYAETGGLMAYGPDLRDNFRRAATYVDKILKGAKPADLPVEQPTKFELVINLKTAKALGLTIPQSLLLRADEVIQ
jgi:putative ABC transport system substrate-binding protein